MKMLVTLIAAVMPLMSLFAQTSLNQPLGSSRTTVEEFLDGRQEASGNIYIQRGQEGQISASTDNFSITFFFEEGVLYKTEMLSDFEDKKSARSTMANFRTHYMSLKAEILDLSTEKNRERFAALHGRELHEVGNFSLPQGGVQIKRTTLALDYAPGQAVSDLRSDDRLYSMLNR